MKVRVLTQKSLAVELNTAKGAWQCIPAAIATGEDEKKSSPVQGQSVLYNQTLSQRADKINSILYVT